MCKEIQDDDEYDRVPAVCLHLCYFFHPSVQYAFYTHVNT